MYTLKVYNMGYNNTHIHDQTFFWLKEEKTTSGILFNYKINYKKDKNSFCDVARANWIEASQQPVLNATVRKTDFSRSFSPLTSVTVESY